MEQYRAVVFVLLLCGKVLSQSCFLVEDCTITVPLNKYSYEIVSESTVCPRSDGDNSHWEIRPLDSVTRQPLTDVAFCSVGEQFPPSFACNNKGNTLVLRNLTRVFNKSGEFNFKFNGSDEHSENLFIKYGQCSRQKLYYNILFFIIAQSGVHLEGSNVVYYTPYDDKVTLSAWSIYHVNPIPEMIIYFNGTKIANETWVSDRNRYSTPFPDPKCVASNSHERTDVYMFNVINPTASSTGEYLIVVDSFTAVITLEIDPSFTFTMPSEFKTMESSQASIPSSPVYSSPAVSEDTNHTNTIIIASVVGATVFILMVVFVASLAICIEKSRKKNSKRGVQDIRYYRREISRGHWPNPVNDSEMVDGDGSESIHELPEHTAIDVASNSSSPIGEPPSVDGLPGITTHTPAATGNTSRPQHITIELSSNDGSFESAHALDEASQNDSHIKKSGTSSDFKEILVEIRNNTREANAYAKQIAIANKQQVELQQEQLETQRDTQEVLVLAHTIEEVLKEEDKNTHVQKTDEGVLSPLQSNTSVNNRPEELLANEEELSPVQSTIGVTIGAEEPVASEQELSLVQSTSGSEEPTANDDSTSTDASQSTGGALNSPPLTQIDSSNEQTEVTLASIEQNYDPVDELMERSPMPMPINEPQLGATSHPQPPTNYTTQSSSAGESIGSTDHWNRPDFLQDPVYNQKPDPRRFHKHVGSKIGSDWKNFSTFVGLTVDETSVIEKENEANYRLTVVLNTWKRKYSADTAYTWRNVIRILYDMQLNDIADYVVKKLRKER